MSTSHANRSPLRRRALDTAALALGLAAGAWIGVAYEAEAATEAEVDRPAVERPVESAPSEPAPTVVQLRIV